MISSGLLVLLDLSLVLPHNLLFKGLPRVVEQSITRRMKKKKKKILQ